MAAPGPDMQSPGKIGAVCTPVLERVSIMIADLFQLPLETVGPRTSPDNVETWDSLQHLNLVLALEQEFDLQFTPEEIEQLLSVELIAALVNEKTLAEKERG